MAHIIQPIIRINGDTEENIFVFGNSLATIANGGAGEDYYLYLSGQVTISDYSSDNRLYFGANITIAAANILRSQLHISFEGSEDTLRLRNFSSYRFFIGGDSEDPSVPFEVNHTQLLASTNSGTNITVTMPVALPRSITTPASERTVEIRANGTIDADTFSLGYDLRAEFNGGAGQDTFAITPYQTDDVQIRDFSVGNLIRFETGVEISDFSINRGTFEISLANDNNNGAVVSVIIGSLQNYQLEEGTVMNADEFIAALTPTEITLGNQVTTLAEDADTRNAIRVATIGQLVGGLELSGEDRALFEVNEARTELRLQAGSILDFETNSELTVIVSSTLNSSVTATLEIMLSDVNDESPIVERTIPPQAVSLANGAFTLDVAGFFSDPDARDSLSYTAVSGDTSIVTATIADGSSTLTLSPMTATDTPVSITVTASDLTELEVAQTFRIYISATPIVPAIEASAIQMSDDDGGFVLNGVGEYDFSGRSVSGAGDVNGDGLADIIIGARDADPNNMGNSGTSYVMFGKSDGGIVELGEIADAEANNNAGFVINGATAGDNSGFSVSGAGDVNGDGLDDLIIGARNADPNGMSNGGVSYVVFGKSDGGIVELSMIDNDDGFVINGAGGRDYSGASVSGAGDVNGDGLDDILIGARGVNGNSGAGYVVFGKRDGGIVELSMIDDDDGFAINGANFFSFSGSSVSGAGDVNGDGLDDVIVGAPYTNYVVFGKTSEGAVQLSDIADNAGFAINGNGSIRVSMVSRAGDVNGDGLDDIIVGAPGVDLNGNYNNGASYVVFGKSDDNAIALSNIANDAGFVINGVDENDRSGYSVSGAGDINGDGLDDLIIGAREADPNGTDSGASYLVFGKSDGSAVELSLVEFGINGFVINGVSGADQSGVSVSGAGDINGDGFDDLIVGANFADPNGNDSGASYVIFGGQGVLSTDAQSLPGDSSANRLIGGAGDDTLLGMGGADVLRGGAGDDVLAISDTDFASIDGGLGTDTLRLDSMITLDLASIPNNRLDSIEIIDLNGTASTLMLAIDDILNIVGSSAQNTLRIDGSSADTLDLNQIAFSDSREADNIGGTDYRVYQAADSLGLADSVRLLVAFDVSVETVIPAVELSAIQLNDNPDGFVLNGVDALDFSGSAVSGAGDINGDGLDDIIIGAHLADPNDSGSGTSYIIFGKTGGNAVELSAIADGDNNDGFVLNGVSENDYSGFSVSGAGDVNGDGLDDILIGAYRADPNGTDSGASYLVFGKTGGGIVELSEIDDANNSDGFVLNGTAGDQSGRSVSGVGDVNGDGLDDIIIGARYADPNDNANSGASYVVFGKSDGGIVELSDIDNNTTTDTTGFAINGVDGFDRSGFSVSAAGDVNGDGMDDILIGAYRAASPDTAFNVLASGTSYVVFGKSDGGIVELSDIEQANGGGFAINGADANDHSGFSVSGAGDINGDGLDDVIVGARYADPNTNANSGTSYVVFGKSDGEIVQLSDIENTTGGGFAINGVDADDRSGRSVSGVGDINGDGLDDIIVGASLAEFAGLENQGVSYLVFGKTDSNTVELSDLEQDTSGFAIYGANGSDLSGASVSGAGDVNGDGFDDLLVGARGAYRNNVQDGASYVIFGGAGVLNLEANTLAGDSTADRLIGGAGDDTLVGNGGADVLRGGAGDDVLAISDAGFASIDGGLGNDSLRLDGEFDLNLLTIPNNRLDSIEIIDLNSTNNNALNLGLEDLLSIVGNAATNTLQIDGSAGDTLMLPAMLFANPSSSVNIAGNTYQEYLLHPPLSVFATPVSLLVQSEITVQGAIPDLAVPMIDDASPITINEALATDTRVYDINQSGTSADVDGDDVPLFYRIESGNLDDAFRIDSGTGEIFVADSRLVDYEVRTMYELQVSATDGGNTDLATIQINLTDIAPTIMSVPEDLTLDEGVANGTVIGTVLLEGDTNSISYQITGGNDAFAIDDSGVITVVDSNVLDFEVATSHILTVQVSDNTAAPVTSTINVMLNDIPAVLDDQTIILASSIEDNGIVTTLVVDDPNSVTYSIQSGNTGGIFAIDNTGQITVTDTRTDTSMLDFINGADISLTVRVVDGVNMDEATITIDLADGVVDLAHIMDSNNGNGFVINGANADDNSGFLVSGAGDVNGDGLADIIIGASSADPNGLLSGASYVVFGKSDGGVVELSDIDDGGGFAINGADRETQSGRSVSGAGDVNGDGLDDIIIGAHRADPNDNSDSGSSYVVFGKSGAGTVELSDLEEENGGGFVLNGVDAEDESGRSVSGAGDVNGDGLDDIIIGAHLADPNGNDSGTSYVVFGKTSGDPVQLRDIDNPDNNNGFVINGVNVDDHSGRSVSGAGDVNGDGLDDILIGAEQVDSNEDRNIGASYVVFGKADGAIVELSDIEEENGGGFVINGVTQDNFSGYSVSAAGDVNGDGLDDILIGARVAHPNDNLFSGASYLVFGKSDGNIVQLSAIEMSDNSNGFVLNGVDRFDRSGRSVSGAGDINGDGLDDILIGAYSADPNGNSSSGTSYLVFGKADGNAVELSDIEQGIGGFVINGVDEDDQSGLPVSGAGDVNGDGFDDLLVGAPFATPNGVANSGASYVIFGGKGVLASAMVGTTGADTLTGDEMANQLIGGAGNDTLVGGGGADVLRGGAGDDVLALGNSTISNSDSVSIDGGLGNDTLRFDAPINLDLSILGNSKIRSIETIDLSSDSGDSTLSLGLSDVLAISGQTTLENPLTILGANGDTVNLSGAPTNGIAGMWSMTNDDANDTYSYTATTSSDVLANILIDSDIIVSII